MAYPQQPLLDDPRVKRRTMLKAGGVLPGRRVAVVGPGALAVSVAKLIVDAGGEVVAICDPNSLRAWAEALPAMARYPGSLARGSARLAALALKGVPMYRGWDVRAIHGERDVDSITLGRVDDQWRPLGQRERTIAADAVCIGYGFAPATDLYQLLGAARRYEPTFGGWAPVLDRGQRSDVPGLYGAGDCAGVSGAAAAPGTGRIAALSAALDLGCLDAAQWDGYPITRSCADARISAPRSCVRRLQPACRRSTR